MMTPEEVRATGAHPGNFKPADLHVPAPAKTAPVWYFIAKYLVPHMHHALQGAWIDGFVAGMEAADGQCGDPSVTSALRDSLTMEPRR
jgi:hypothetical protein